jgi:hypothetical protein
MLKIDIDALILHEKDIGSDFIQNIMGMVFKDNSTTSVDRKFNPD